MYVVGLTSYADTEGLLMSSLSCDRQQLKGSVKEPNMFYNYEPKKITRKASDAAENPQL